jgi:hypothetical protein
MDIDIITDMDTEDEFEDKQLELSRNDKGQWLPGQTGNPKGRPKKIQRLTQLIKDKTGPDCNKIINRLMDIALYDPDELEQVIDEKTGEIKLRKRRYHFVNATTQLNAIQLLLAYVYGRPTEKQEIDKNVNINIEKKVADITQLINMNKNKIKLVK